MKCFVTLEAVDQARLPANLRIAVTRSVRNMLDVHGDRYDPANDGSVVLVEQITTDEDALLLFGHMWSNAPLEAVTYDRETGTFLAVVLLNNQLAHSIIVPDMPWISPAFRVNLLENLCGKERP
ncbi:hypothetical protein [Pelotalea chapellei]|uniref:Uncharacterized protein n=1 Tax=Pelotalea chapellei TaxID=44671 RepID=A0ABS5UCQ4_9BACT|nr:hypothetical protein [Pelotalea chapellei]MBT1073488.1 hypothetical protein [Pelotalea chapellei]